MSHHPYGTSTSNSIIAIAMKLKRDIHQPIFQQDSFSKRGALENKAVFIKIMVEFYKSVLSASMLLVAGLSI